VLQCTAGEIRHISKYYLNLKYICTLSPQQKDGSVVGLIGELSGCFINTDNIVIPSLR
jgi:hypothetical protein